MFAVLLQPLPFSHSFQRQLLPRAMTVNSSLTLRASFHKRVYFLVGKQVLTPTTFTTFEVLLKFMETGLLLSTLLAVSAQKQGE